ncbi:SMC-Scp complex subunit ScpB [Lachnotalea sp. AF33-28]|uniref:SMC-Scp complex subunit ScpB n=1 Tax=Lachnotalea sp. AF33-28 TaxID=2292046 RepID=UPI000E4C4C46|nr:SMC-Scp complex subunit ScpB [Lachnotalea sp. AF33-28]RHP32786.1 SMC-Scp complex subunit ScpB [Lachnotalea sp. AF33-28]
MEIQKIEAAIEAILFTMGQSVEVKTIAKAVEQDAETTKRIIHNMMDKYESEDRGIRIVELEDRFQMCTKVQYYEQLIRVASEPKKQVLSEVVLETLAIIAYKQPITKSEIEKIRGVSSDHAVNKLVEYNLVCEAGRLNAPGRPILFATTEDFLRKFGVGSLEELPEMDTTKIEEFKAEAEEEVQMELDV